MSSAVPGGQPSRSILKMPAGCLFFAGEATHETLWGTVDGAWESGERAADAALQKIGPPKATPAARALAPRQRYQAEPPRQAAPPARAPYSPID
jgi:Flavin containing amine oxidoreductase